MDRRNFLKSTTGTALSLMTGVSSFALAQTSKEIRSSAQTGPLIVVFLRGGADGLGILSPLEDRDFMAARPPQMRFEATSNPVVSEGTKFYWHPSAEPLSELMMAGRLVPWNAVGITNETRSHFEAQEMMERGVNNLQNLPDSLGMISRISMKNPPPDKADQWLFSGTNNVPRAFQGNLPTLAVRDLQNGIPFPGGASNLNVIQKLAQVDKEHPVASGMSMTLDQLDKIQKVLLQGDKKIKAYESSGATPYPNSDPGIGLRSIARLLSTGMHLQYAWVDQGGWDMHEGQPGRMNNTLGQLSNALKAFDQDMQAQQKKYTLVVLTEFGRRFRSNNSNGTDHGHGGLSLVLGGGFTPGKMYGRWPGLGEKDLDRGVDLDVTTPYQEVIDQALKWGRLV